MMPGMSSDADRWYLAIDLGTGGTKVARVTADGVVQAAAFRSVDTTYTADGGAEQDTEAWWSGLVEAVREVVADAGTPCAGVGITGQWGSTIPVGADGRAVGPCLLWSDHRGGRWSKRLAGGPIAVSGYAPHKIARWLRLAGGAPNPNGADPTGHEQFLANARPAVHAAATSLMEPVDYIGLRLTGRTAATPASMVASWLTDNRVGAVVAYNDTLVRLARRSAAKLPPLVPTGSQLGGLTDDVAAEIGRHDALPVGTPVVCGAPDLHTAAMGAGAATDFAGHIAISTTAWVSAPVPFKKTDITHQMASVPGLRSGSYLIANNHETGGAALRWLRDSVLTVGDGFQGGYDALTAEAAGAPAGSGGVVFCPWLSGERSPVSDANLRASFLNVSMGTTRAHLVRAVLEGVAYNARWLLEATEKFAGRPLDGLRLLGGGATSDLWCQIHADVIGRPILQVADPVNVNVRGAAWFAALHLGHLTLDEITAASPASTVFTPIRANTDAHAPLYAEFVQLAKAQRAMYRRLNGRH
ncbi:MAG: glpK 1 [Ilumatobacteraceae bacterium]|nr:glpK 1 [Ilumatobacteraceae bacterium]